MLNEQTGWPTIPGKFSWVNSSGGLGQPTVPVLEKIGVASPPLIGSTYPSAYQQAPSTMASLYGQGAQCWWVIPTNCPVKCMSLLFLPYLSQISMKLLETLISLQRIKISIYECNVCEVILVLFGTINFTTKDWSQLVWTSFFRIVDWLWLPVASFWRKNRT